MELVLEAARPKRKFSQYGKHVDLMVFAQGGDSELVVEIANEIDVNTLRDAHGYTALHLAAMSNRANTCMVLVQQANADIEVRTDTGLTPLHVAALRGHRQTIEMLIQLGADANAQDEEYGDTPLHKVVWEGHLQCAIPLLKGGASLTIKDKNGCNVIRLGKVNHQDQIVALLDTIRVSSTRSRGHFKALYEQVPESQS